MRMGLLLRMRLSLCLRMRLGLCLRIRMGLLLRLGPTLRVCPCVPTHMRLRPDLHQDSVLVPKQRQHSLVHL